MTLRSWSKPVAALAVLLAGGGLAFGVIRLTGDGSDLLLVVRVIDGDTIELENGEIVRYLLIDTPETMHPEKSVECYGPEASEANRRLTEGQKVRLERDVTDRDTYGRLLRYVYVDGVLVQAELVREGYGYVYSRKPDVRHLRDMAALEREARERGAGLWAACNGS